MIKESLQYILLFFAVILLQVLLFNNIQLSGYINPYIYILFILLLPFETPGYLLLILSFFLGLSVDVFSNTPGLHASASVFMAVFRPGVLSLISMREMYEKGTSPRVKYYGVVWFFKYALILTLIHHLALFFMEAFTVAGFLHTTIRCLASAGISISIIVLSQFIVFKD